MLNGASARRSLKKIDAHTPAPLLAELPQGSVIHSGQVVQAGGNAAISVSPDLPALSVDSERQLTIAEVARVVDSERRRVVARLFRRCPSKEYAEDACGEVVQRLFRKVLREGLRFSSDRAVIGWLHVSADFVLRERYRSTDALDHAQARDDRADGAGHSGGEGEIPAVTVSSIEDRLAAKHQLALLADLSPEDRQLLQEAVEGDRSGPASDVYRRRVCRARQRAQQLIGKERPAPVRRALNAPRTATRDI